MRVDRRITPLWRRTRIDKVTTRHILKLILHENARLSITGLAPRQTRLFAQFENRTNP